MLAIVLVVVLMLLAPCVLAQPAPASPTPPPASSPEADEAGEMVAIEQGQPAPFAGILLTVVAFTRAAGLQLQLDRCSGERANRDAMLVESATKLADLTVRAVEAESRSSDPGWWGRHGFTVGVIVGVAATVTATVLLWNAVDDGGG